MILHHLFWFVRIWWVLLRTAFFCELDTLKQFNSVRGFGQFLMWSVLMLKFARYQFWCAILSCHRCHQLRLFLISWISVEKSRGVIKGLLLSWNVIWVSWASRQMRIVVTAFVAVVVPCVLRRGWVLSTLSFGVTGSRNVMRITCMCLHLLCLEGR